MESAVMESTAHESRCFPYAIAWWRLMALAALSFPFLLFGWLVGWMGTQLADVSSWVLLASGVVWLGVAITLIGVGVLVFVVWASFLRLIRWPVVRVTPEGLGLARYIGLRSVFVPFDAVVWVKRENPVRRVDYIWIVHGANLQTECVARLALRPPDYDALLAILVERCPNAHTPEPPAGWQRPHD
jgi:hypothetical protein